MELIPSKVRTRGTGRRKHEPGRHSKAELWRRGSCTKNDDVLVSYNNTGELGVASELQELTLDTDDPVVRSETAQAELAACVRTVRRCTAVVMLCQGWLGGGSD